MANHLTWAGLALLLSGAACTGQEDCTTDELPESDPCYQKSCCETVPIAADAGAGVDAGPAQVRFCGACNG
ncbi:MAG: hypothetical protein IPG45_27310 [Deltaproteobacteria bacterium]|nr:hypothetical protein [Deltaproteobacteria bacterium]